LKPAIKSTKMITMGLFSLYEMGLTNTTLAALKTTEPIEFKFIGKVNTPLVFQFKNGITKKANSFSLI
jgi:hypothetical protein